MRKQRKCLSALLTAAAIICSATACGKTESGPTDAAINDSAAEKEEENAAAESVDSGGASEEKGEKTITIAWANIMESQQQVWEKYVFAPFLEKHPEVTIDFQCLPDLQQTVRVQLAAGAGPDMFCMDSVDISDYASAGRILNLEEYRTQYDMDNKFFGWTMPLCLYQDEMYALPASVEATAMTYNKNLLEQLGKEIPVTREDFVSICDAALESGLIPVAFGYSGANLLMA